MLLVKQEQEQQGGLGAGLMAFLDKLKSGIEMVIEYKSWKKEMEYGVDGGRGIVFKHIW